MIIIINKLDARSTLPWDNLHTFSETSIRFKIIIFVNLKIGPYYFRKRGQKCLHHSAVFEERARPIVSQNR